MERVQAFDVNGIEIKRGDIVKIVKTPSVTHGWLKVGNTLRVTNWEDRSLGKNHIVVFLKSKKGGNCCSMGVQDNRLMVMPEK